MILILDKRIVSFVKDKYSFYSCSCDIHEDEEQLLQ